MKTYIRWMDIQLFYGKLPSRIVRHQHPVIQLIIGVEKPFRKKEGKGTWKETRSLFVAPNTPHECDAANQKICSISIEPDSLFGEYILTAFFKDQSLISFSENELAQFDFTKFDHLLGSGLYGDLHEFIKEFFSGVSIAGGLARDLRVEKVKNFIKNHIHSRIESKELCELVHLSESRLMHLFKETVGIPIRNYILWVRLNKAVSEIISGRNLTYAAHAAGFSDSAHMSKTFLKTVGIAPSKLVKNSRFVQVQEPRGSLVLKY